MFLGIVFIAIGIWWLIHPKSAIKFRIQLAKYFGMKITATNKTEKAYTYFGIALIVLGIILIIP